MDNVMQTFFENLAIRKRKENDLSDVTYALCESHKGFRQFFLDYFFGEDTVSADQVTIDREFYTSLGRPDFMIRSIDQKARKYIVEVKIWDGNHHFQDYYKILNDDRSPNSGEASADIWRRLGYIANYDLDDIRIAEDYIPSGCDSSVKSIGCAIRTWKGFVGKLNDSALKNDELVNAYVVYVKQVCPFDEFNLQGMKISADHFGKVAAFLNDVEKGISNAGCKVYNSSRKFYSQYRMGLFFSFDLEPSKTVWGWFGVYYCQAGVQVCVEFEDRPGWGRLVCDRYRTRKVVKDGCLRFYLKSNRIDDEFTSLVDALKNNDKVDAWLGSSNNAEYKDVLSMKALPFALETIFFKNNIIENKGGERYQLILGVGNDSEVMDSHCGRYFDVVREGGEPGSPSVVRGWLGIMYNKSKQNAQGKLFSKTPTFVIEMDQSFVKEKMGVAQFPADGWYADDWGWAACDIDCKDTTYEDLFQRITDKIRSVVMK